MPKFITRVNVTPAAGTWETIDVTSYVGADAGTLSGVLLKVINESLVEYTLGIRKFGSSDVIQTVFEDKCWNQFAVGVDSSNRFQVNIQNVAIKIYLEGYFLTNEAVFFTDVEANDITPGTAGSLQTVDITSLTGGGSKVAILYIDNTGAADYVAYVQKYNLTETTFNGNVNGLQRRCFWVAVDSEERFNIFIANLAVKVYLAGYLTNKVITLDTNTQITLNTTVNWEDIDISALIPSGNNGMLFTAGQLGATPFERYLGLRKNGDTFEPSDIIYWDCAEGTYGLSEIDSNRIIEVKRESTITFLWLWGYTSESDPVGAGDLNLDLSVGSQGMRPVY